MAHQMSIFESIPNECLMPIVDNLDRFGSLALRGASKRFRGIIGGLVPGENFQLEKWHKTYYKKWIRQPLGCCKCHLLRSRLSFGDKAIKGQRNRGGSKAKTRVCLECGVIPDQNGNAYYSRGTWIAVQGKPHVVCMQCGRLGETSGKHGQNKHFCPPCRDLINDTPRFAEAVSQQTRVKIAQRWTEVKTSHYTSKIYHKGDKIKIPLTPRETLHNLQKAVSKDEKERQKEREEADKQKAQAKKAKSRRKNAKYWAKKKADLDDAMRQKRFALLETKEREENAKAPAVLEPANNHKKRKHEALDSVLVAPATKKAMLEKQAEDEMPEAKLNEAEEQLTATAKSPATTKNRKKRRQEDVETVEEPRRSKRLRGLGPQESLPAPPPQAAQEATPTAATEEQESSIPESMGMGEQGSSVEAQDDSSQRSVQEQANGTPGESIPEMNAEAALLAYVQSKKRTFDWGNESEASEEAEEASTEPEAKPKGRRTKNRKKRKQGGVGSCFEAPPAERIGFGLVIKEPERRRGTRFG